MVRLLVVTSSGSASVTAAQAFSAFANAPTGVAVLSPASVVTGANPALGRILGRPLSEVVGGDLFRFVHPEDLELALASSRAFARAPVPMVEPMRVQCRFTRPDGTSVWVRVSTTRVADTAAQPAHSVMHVEDISEQKALEARLWHQARHDPLTGLGNRTLLGERVHADLTTAAAAHPTARAGGGWLCAVVVLDLDGFKALNDALGHPRGDAALVAVANGVRAVLVPGELAVRLGGDEFAVWCPATTALRLAVLNAALRAAIAALAPPGAGVAPLTASLGSATHTHPTPGRDSPGLDWLTTLSSLLVAADAAMYADKRRARPTPS